MNHPIDSRADARSGLLQIVLAAILWGTVGVATKYLFTISSANALSIGFFRLALATPVLLATCWYLLGARAFRIPAGDMRYMVLIGVAMAFYQVSYFAAIARVGVAIAVLITLCTAPVLVSLLSALLLRERLSRAVLAALVCALAGTVMLVWVGPATGAVAQQTLTGIVLALGSACGYSLIALFSRTLAGRYHPLQPITVGFAAGALILLPFALAAGLVVTYPPAGWALLVYMGLVPTALAYVLFLAGMRHTTATVATIATLIEPLTSTTLAWLLFGERLGPLGLLGALLLLGAIGLLYADSARRTQAPPE
jgi:DME family drug/metabolite transporter